MSDETKRPERVYDTPDGRPIPTLCPVCGANLPHPGSEGDGLRERLRAIFLQTFSPEETYDALVAFMRKERER